MSSRDAPAGGGSLEIARLEPERYGEASTILARAFLYDPAWTWLIPDHDRRERLLPPLFRAGFDVTSADVWATAGTVRGAARWLPPGRPAIRVAATLRAAVTTPARLGRATGAFLAYGRAVESVRAEVAGGGPHWYLAGIGVDPDAQRSGIGGALLQPGIEGAAHAGIPAVLLTNNEANLSFYGRHGFEVVREGETPRGGPKAWAMVRRA